MNKDFMQSFEDWMDSEEGTQSMEALEYVQEMLTEAKVDIEEKKIIWTDEQRLTIEQSTEKIMEHSGLEKYPILSHIIGWLQMSYEPEGLDEKQMEIFESRIESWTKKYEKQLEKMYYSKFKAT
jgi:arsenate reductase-like glutaredoxin family protein